jgi:hypothetical protein
MREQPFAQEARLAKPVSPGSDAENMGKAKKSAEMPRSDRARLTIC